MKLLYKLLIFTLPMLSAAGCASYSERLTDVRRAYADGQFEQAYLAAEKNAAVFAKKNSDRDALPALLEAGSVSRTADRIADSQHFLSRAEQIYELHLSEARHSLTGETFALLTDPTTLPYRGSGADALMLCTYRALNALQLGNIAGARQPLMRADIRQKENLALNTKELEATRKAARKDKNATEIDQSRNSPLTKKATKQILEDLPDTHGYELYVNPFTEFLIAFYHRYAGVDAADRETARFRMRRALSLAPNCSALRYEAERLDRGLPSEPSVYLFFEDGMAPYRTEESFTLPIYVGHTVSTVSLAFPKLKRDSGIPGSAKISGGGHTASAELVCDMEAVLSKEFRNSFSTELTRAIASATVKAVAAYAINYSAQQADNGFVSFAALLATSAYNAATAHADLRSWTTLPRAISVARIPLPADRRVALRINDTSRTLHLNGSSNIWVVCVRSPRQGAAPHIAYFPISQ